MAFLERHMADEVARLGRQLRIGISGWNRGRFALPLADAEHVVTVIERDESRWPDARQTAEECGVSISMLGERSLARIEEKFDLLLIDASENEDLSTPLAALSPLLAPLGSAIVIGQRRTGSDSFEAFRSTLASSGWRVIDAMATVAREKTLRVRPSAQSFLDRVLEQLVSLTTSLSKSAAWIVQIIPSDATRPSIIHIMPGFGMGGAERVVLDLSSGLQRKGFDVSVISFIEDGVLRSEFQARGIRTRVLHRRDPFGISTVRDLVRIFQHEQPDIVHTHLFGADAWGRLAAFIARVPIVFSTEHNINPSYGIIKRFLNWLFAKKTHAIIAVSEGVKETSLQKDRIPASKLRVISNGIDIERLPMRGGHGFHDIPRLVTVGRLFPQKDHATLLKALALVRRPWTLRIIGDGPLSGELHSLANRLGIASRVTWLGVRHDVPELLAESDLFCFPSRWEGLGNAALEAAAAGVPAIVSDLAPLRNAFASSDVLFVSAGDVPAWAHAIQSVLDHPAVAVARALRAAPSIRANNSSERMVGAYADLYRSFLTPRV